MSDRNGFMLKGRLSRRGYDWWWHSLLAREESTGEIHPFFIEYYFLNPALAREDPVLGQLPVNRASGKAPSYAMIKAGKWGTDKSQIHNFYGLGSFFADSGRMEVTIGRHTASESSLRGAVNVTVAEAEAHPEWMSDAGTMSWDLHIRRKVPYSVGYGASPIFRMLNMFEMYWHVGGLLTDYEGTIIYNGKRYLVDPSLGSGYQDKNWGSDYTNPWIWLQCGRFTDEAGNRVAGTAFTVGGGNPKIKGMAVGRKILVAFLWQEQIFEFNFTRIFFQNQQWNCRIDEQSVFWDVSVSNRTHRLELHFSCPLNLMVRVNYENPDGEHNHRNLYNGGHARGTLELYRLKRGGDQLLVKLFGEYGGCEFGEY